MSELRDKMNAVAVEYIKNDIEQAANAGELTAVAAELLGGDYHAIFVPRKFEPDLWILKHSQIRPERFGRVVVRVDKCIYLNEKLKLNLQTFDAAKVDYLAEFIAETIYKNYDEKFAEYVAKFDELEKERAAIDDEKALLKVDYDSIAADIAENLGFAKNADGSYTFIDDAYSYKLATKNSTSPHYAETLRADVCADYDEYDLNGQFRKRHIFIDREFFRDDVDLILKTTASQEAFTQFKVSLREKIK